VTLTLAGQEKGVVRLERDQRASRLHKDVDDSTQGSLGTQRILETRALRTRRPLRLSS